MGKHSEIVVRMVLLVTAVLAVSACKGSHAGLGQEANRAAAPSPTANSLETSVRAYKSWRLVNPQPFKKAKVPPVPPGVAVRGTACTDPMVFLDDPHRDKFISVYVNEIGEHAMMAEAHPRFPPGAIIVKEKRDTEEADGTPVLMTIMVKHDKGYDVGNADWEFLVMDGAMTKVAKPAKEGSCMGCHVTYSKTDYVTRLYLPKDVEAQLR